MSSISLNSNFHSPLGRISKFLGNSLEKLIVRQLDKVKLDIQNIYEAEINHLEHLNRYKEFSINHVEELENELRAYQEVIEIIGVLNTLLKVAKADVPQEDALYVDLVLLVNQIHDLHELIEKVILKMEQIHSKILVKSTEMMSSEILNEIWKDEEELWDNFYIESQKTE
jgi:hypothetical protein